MSTYVGVGIVKYNIGNNLGRLVIVFITIQCVHCKTYKCDLLK